MYQNLDFSQDIKKSFEDYDWDIKVLNFIYPTLKLNDRRHANLHLLPKKLEKRSISFSLTVC